MTDSETEPNTSAMPARTKRRNSTRLTVSGAALVWAMIATAGIVGLATWAITVAVARPHTAGIGAWISDFAKSSGLAGVLAVVAALIAFFGLNLQLSHQRRAEAGRAWWERFQWASSRALPVDPKHEALPYDAVVSTLNALFDSAIDNVQEGAVGAVMEVASARSPVATASASDSSLVEDRDLSHDADEKVSEPVISDSAVVIGPRLSFTDANLAALTSYVSSTAGTPADSPQTRARLLETEVGIALQDAGVSVHTSAVDGPDFIVKIGSRRIGVEVKLFSDARRARLVDQSVRRLQTYVQGGLAAVLVVSNEELILPPGAADAGLHAFHWRGTEEDTVRLIQRINQLAEDPGKLR